MIDNVSSNASRRNYSRRLEDASVEKLEEDIVFDANLIEALNTSR